MFWERPEPDQTIHDLFVSLNNKIILFIELVFIYPPNHDSYLCNIVFACHS